MDKKAAAKMLLVHYFRTIYKITGNDLDYENIAEIEGIIDLIIEAVQEEAKNEIQS